MKKNVLPLCVCQLWESHLPKLSMGGKYSHTEIGLSIHFESGNVPLKSFGSMTCCRLTQPNRWKEVGQRDWEGSSLSMTHSAVGTLVPVFIQWDKFNPWLFLRDKTVSRENINKERGDITKVRRDNSFKSIFWSKQKKKHYDYIFHRFNSSLQIFRILLFHLNFLDEWCIYNASNYMQ